MQRRVAIVAAAIAVVGIGAGAFLALQPASDRFAECRSTQIAGPGVTIGGDFTLVSETGATVTEADIVKGLTLVYLGYTFCPDFCPADAARNADAVDALAARGIEVTPVFISIDPARDTPEALADFTDRVHPGMVGLTGSQEQIDAVVKAYRAFAQKAGEGEEYLMNHSTFSYLLAPGRGVIDVIRHEQTAEDIERAVACFAEKLGA